MPRSDSADHPRAAAIQRMTGRPFADWCARLDDAGARDLDHTATARLIHEDWGMDAWWAQTVTVAYEQWIGRREVGQTCEGDFAVSASRTLPGGMDEVRDAFDSFADEDRREELGLGEPRLSDTERWRYWRADAADGSQVSVNITAKDEGRCTLSIAHKQIASAAERDAWKARWAETLTAFLTWTKEHA